MEKKEKVGEKSARNAGEMRGDAVELEGKLRQIVIETDGNDVFVRKAEVTGKIEFLGILQAVINHIREQK